MATPHTIRVVKPLDKAAPPFHLGTTTGPNLPALGIDSTSLLRDRKRWLPVMGEIHFSRVNPGEWRKQLLLMRAGGIDVVATYLFWIHHEESQGEWNWTGSRDLRQFVEVCHDINMPLALRLGPWCHGECRNGGLPDWVQHGGVKTRSEDPRFMDWTRSWYEQIEKQIRGFLWKNGGPIMSAQVDNEFGGPASYLLALKKIAIESAIDVPFYIRTGWPPTSTPVAFGELIPLYGAYAEGFWDRSTNAMPGEHWHAFCFDQLRTDVEVGADQLGQGVAKDEIDASLYPHLMCELGGGMEQSYHRRLVIHPQDTYAMALTKIGCGNNMPGYYMYHGGTNPSGKTTLHESQATHYANDVPVKSYDFQAPLGQYGQVNESFNWLRKIHLFINDFGEQLAAMPATVSPQKPQGKHDVDTLRWSVRSDGKSGFVFVSNYQRGTDMPAKENVQFELQLPDKAVTLPSQPITVPANASFIWPFDLEMNGIKLRYATAQLVCRLDRTNTFVFAQTPGVAMEFWLEPGVRVSSSNAQRTETPDGVRLTQIDLSRGRCIALSRGDRQAAVVILTDEESRKCQKIRRNDREEVILSDWPLYVDQGRLCAQDQRVEGPVIVEALQDNGEFVRSPLPVTATVLPKISANPLQPAGPLREIKKGSAGVAEAPSEEDFKNAAVWKIEFSSPPDTHLDLLLRIQYTGDVARLYLGDELLNDSFYHTRPFDLSLKGLDLSKELSLKILPLRRTPMILLPGECDAQDQAVEVKSVELIERKDWEIKLT